jgi:hypothetical protein
MRCGEYGFIFDSEDEKIEFQAIRNNPVIMSFMNTFIGSWLIPILQKGSEMSESEKTEYKKRLLDISRNNDDKQALFLDEIANAQKTHPFIY